MRLSIGELDGLVGIEPYAHLVCVTIGPIVEDFDGQFDGGVVW